MLQSIHSISSQLISSSAWIGKFSTLFFFWIFRNEFISALELEKELFLLLENKNVEPSLLSLAWALKNERLIKQELFAEAYTSVLCLIEYNKTHGTLYFLVVNVLRFY